MEQIKYEELKDSIKVKRRSLSLYDYIATNHRFNPAKPFHELTKEELISEYEKLVERDINLLRNL